LASARAPEAMSNSFSLSARPSQEYVDVNPMKANEYSCFCQIPGSGGVAGGVFAGAAPAPRAQLRSAPPTSVASFEGIRTTCLL
jgi:hypothetical protein